VIWGYWDGSHWLDNAPFYREDWSEKPSLAVEEPLADAADRRPGQHRLAEFDRRLDHQGEGVVLLAGDDADPLMAGPHDVEDLVSGATPERAAIAAPLEVDAVVGRRLRSGTLGGNHRGVQSTSAEPRCQPDRNARRERDPRFVPAGDPA